MALVWSQLATLLARPEPADVRSLVESVFRSTAACTKLDDRPFYAAIFSASGGRVVVRDWFDTTIAGVRRELAQHFCLHRLVEWDEAEGRRERSQLCCESSTFPSRVKQMGSTLGARFVLQPGLAYVSEDMEDKFELFGIQFLRTGANTLGLWFRLWDTKTGEFLFETSGKATVAAELLNEGAAVPFHESARRLWRQMIQEGLRNGKTQS
jgi:hypothetical protein